MTLTLGLWLMAQVSPLALVMFVLLVGTPDGILFFLTQRWRRTPNISYSGGPGDLALTAVIGIAATVLQKYLTEPQPNLPDWFVSPRHQVGALLICMGIGFAANKTVTYARPYVPDNYHNLVVVPLYLYLVVAVAIPILAMPYIPYGYGAKTGAAWWQGVLALALLAFYIFLVVKDFREHRIDQP